jgi:hypothetical protein
MIKKLGNKTLLLLLVAMLAVVGIVRYISTRNGENTFKTAIVTKIDSARMNGMIIFQKTTKKGTPLPFIFTRKGKEWIISEGNVSGRADQRSAEYMKSQLEHISPDRLASNDPAEWKDYNVNDSLGTRVVFLYDKDTALDVIVGRFSYIPSRKQAITYLRLAGQKEVYAIDGMLAMNISEEFNAWRDRKIVPDEYVTGWNKLTFAYPNDSGFALQKDTNTNQWAFSDGKVPDSLAVAHILQDISGQNYGTFINNFDSSGKQPVFSLRIEGKPFGAVVIKAYPAGDANKYAINSSINPTSFMSGIFNNTVSKLFPSKATFFRKDFKPMPPTIRSVPMRGRM